MLWKVLKVRSKQGTVRVVSKRKGGIEPVAGELVIDVDRVHPILGNRHILHNYRDMDERARVIAAYDEDLAKDVAKRGPMLLEVERLAKRVKEGERLALRCWCAPLPCHAEILAHKIAEIAGTEFLPIRVSKTQRCPDEQGSLF